LKSANS